MMLFFCLWVVGILISIGLIVGNREDISLIDFASVIVAWPITVGLWLANATRG